MTWCPLLCYPLSPSPVNIERFFKLGAKFCRKKFSSQALNCFLLLVHTASSFATGQKELMFQRKKSQCLRMKIWMISTLASLLPLHPPRQVQGLPELIGCQSHPPCKMVKQVNWGKRKTLESVAVDYHFRYLVLYQDLEWFESIIDNCHFLEFSILAAFPRSSCQPLEIWQPQSK